MHTKQLSNNCKEINTVGWDIYNMWLNMYFACRLHELHSVVIVLNIYEMKIKFSDT
jgi:hypothetical protein